MTRTAYVDWPTGPTLYAKPRPITTATWAADVVAGTENGTTGEYSFAAISETIEYVLYLRAGVSPASTDTKIGYIEGGVALTDSATELVANAVSEILAGAGENVVTITVSNSSAEVIQGARVSLVGTTHKLTTGSDGTAVFNLDAGSYTVRVSSPSGYADPDDTAITVDGTEAVPITLSTTGTVTPPDNPLLTTLSVLCVDETGAAEEGVTIEAKLVEIPTGGTGLAYDGLKQTATSGVDGVATLTLVRLAKYQVKRGESKWSNAQTVTIADEGTTTIASFIGVDAV